MNPTWRARHLASCFSFRAGYVFAVNLYSARIWLVDSSDEVQQAWFCPSLTDPSAPETRPGETSRSMLSSTGISMAVAPVVFGYIG